MAFTPIFTVLAAVGALVATVGPSAALAQQPFIDKQLEEIRKEDAERAEDGEVSEKNYSEHLKEKIKVEDREEERVESGSYIDELREKNPDLIPDRATPESYSQSQKSTLEPKPEGGAIQAVNDGNSELQMKRPGKIRGALGLHFGAVTLAKSFSSRGAVAGRAYSDTYGTNYDPNFTLHYEWQPFHSEIFGNFGLFFEGGIFMNSGYGKYDGYDVAQIPLPSGSGSFPETSQTYFKFFAFPIVVGLNYRFNLTYILRPYAGAGLGFVPMVETRTDQAAPNRAWTSLIQASGGVSLLLDFLSKPSAWEMYSDYGVKHSYLFAEVRAWLPFAGDVSLSMTGVYAGFLAEI